ncbi:hypothetical protein [Streptomyces inusitatus]|nr:hypothetical protein [Streptomyces inusitatus]
MKVLLRHMVVLCSALFAVISMSVGVAQAAPRPVPVTAGDKYAIKSVGVGLYVSAEVDNSGATEGMLRARKAGSKNDLGSWERFTLHTDDKGETITLRSEANGNYVTTERGYTGSHRNLLRARGTTVGGWEKLQLVRQPDGYYALRAQKAGTDGMDVYVTAEKQDAGNDAGLLRARASAVGSWEKFELEFLGESNPGGEGSRPQPAAPVSAVDIRVMSWNLCANHNDKCGNFRTEGGELGNQITSQMGSTTEAQQYRAIFLQEICESQASEIETKLELKTGTGWSVRFAPIKYAVDDSSVNAARTCHNAGSAGAWKDRGAYGIGLAIPDSNVWYTSYDLPSPANRTIDGAWVRIEQRTALCAVLPAQALQFCTAHFSAGLSTDDADGTKRKEQAALLQQIVHSYTPAGYRTVYGGDFNAVPPDSASPDTPKDVMASAYQKDKECDEGRDAARPRDGRATKPLEGRSIKIDYLFAPSSATFLSCDVTNPNPTPIVLPPTDHYPVKAHLRIPAL